MISRGIDKHVCTGMTDICTITRVPIEVTWFVW